MSAGAEEELPPPPARYFNDYAGVVLAEAAERIEAKLRAFDEQTSSQVVVAVFPELPSPSLEDFTVRTAQSWRVGRKKLDNGVVLFVFVKDRKIRLEVGYGLEGALPDATAQQIISDLIVPRFRRGGDYAGGLEAAVDAIIAATRGEYQAAPRPASPQPVPVPAWVVVLFILFFVVLPIWRRARKGPRTYHRRGWDTPWWWGSGGGRGGGWGSGGFGGGGGGFSGGGGGFGGGGASGSW